jgi:hypothetical protein
MSRFVEGQDRQQVTLLPECLDDFIAEDNPVRVVDAFVAELDLGELGFEGVRPADTGRPSYHPAVLLKIYIYGYLDEYQCPAGERAIHRFNCVEGGLMMRTYWSSACPGCAIRAQCTTSAYRRIRRWEHEAVLEQMQRRLDRKPEAMTLRRSTVEHVFGTLKHWMGTTHFLTRRLEHVSTEMSLHVLAYNLKRVMQVLGIARTMKAMSLVGA